MSGKIGLSGGKLAEWMQTDSHGTARAAHEMFHFISCSDDLLLQSKSDVRRRLHMMQRCV